MSGILYVAPTPVGNLDDMTFRAINVLREADLILAEDTRTTGKLTAHFDIDTPKQAFHHGRYLSHGNDFGADRMLTPRAFDWHHNYCHAIIIGQVHGPVLFVIKLGPRTKCRN